MRKHYLDNIRWATVLLVLVYHVFYIFNGVGILGGIPDAKSIALFDGISALIYPWFMVLLFVVSGMSARYALDKKTNKDFLRERERKLLVPSTLGLFVIHWVTGYFNLKMGGALHFMPKALIYPISVISGGGHLWFIQLLFLYSCILILIKKLDKDRLWRYFEKVNTVILFLIAFLIFLSAQVLNMPILTVYRFGIYFVSFLIGYFIFSHESIQDKIEKARWWSLVLTIVMGVWYAAKIWGMNFTLENCLKNIITNMYLWFVVLAVLGWGKRYFNKPTDYMAKSSFGIYILHYPVLICVCFVLENYFKLPAIANYGIALILEFLLTFAIYELISRLPIIMYLVLGKRSRLGLL